jgi:hypothetical protein
VKATGLRQKASGLFLKPVAFLRLMPFLSERFILFETRPRGCPAETPPFLVCNLGVILVAEG